MLLKRLVLQTHNGYPVEINSKGFDDWTALHFASYEDHY
jgi:ankyrin repeat protein